MSSETEIAGLYREFTNALTEILAENAAVSPARRGRSREPMPPSKGTPAIAKILYGS
jgi:hypothetical protein